MGHLIYKKGINKIDLTNDGYGMIAEKVYFVYDGEKCIGHISKCDTLGEWDAWKDNDSDIICAGDTLRECKATLERITAINEALGRFNGYWANDYTVCDAVAHKYGFDAKWFGVQVYKKVNENINQAT